MMTALSCAAGLRDNLALSGVQSDSKSWTKQSQRQSAQMKQYDIKQSGGRGFASGNLAAEIWPGDASAPRGRAGDN
jgi:hypothetical protein